MATPANRIPVCKSCIEAIQEVYKPFMPQAGDEVSLQTAAQLARQPEKDIPDHSCDRTKDASITCNCDCGKQRT